VCVFFVCVCVCVCVFLQAMRGMGTIGRAHASGARGPCVCTRASMCRWPRAHGAAPAPSPRTHPGAVRRGRDRPVLRRPKARDDGACGVGGPAAQRRAGGELVAAAVGQVAARRRACVCVSVSGCESAKEAVRAPVRVRVLVCVCVCACVRVCVCVNLQA